MSRPDPPADVADCAWHCSDSELEHRLSARECGDFCGAGILCLAITLRALISMLSDSTGSGFSEQRRVLGWALLLNAGLSALLGLGDLLAD